MHPAFEYGHQNVQKLASDFLLRGCGVLAVALRTCQGTNNFWEMISNPNESMFISQMLQLHKQEWSQRSQSDFFLHITLLSICYQAANIEARIMCTTGTLIECSLPTWLW